MSPRVIALTLLAFLTTAQSLSACSVPVFRFALERWAPDLFEISVFYRGTLNDSDEQRLTQLEDWAVRNGGNLNLEVVRCNVDGDVPDDLLAIWKSLNTSSLPTVVVRTPRKSIGQTIVWHGRLSDPFLDALAISAARREIAQRLLQGDAVVWLLVRGTDSEQAKRTRRTLDAALEQVAEQIELSAGIGRPGSELLTQVPLQLKFSVVEISADAREEQVLLQLLRTALPRPPRGGDSLIAPIFGRGRVLGVQSARDLELETITDLTTYLCSACSCQIKQQNPGFDLLCAMNWDERLFGESFDRSQLAAADSPAAAGTSATDTEPTLVTIPSGHELRDSATSSVGLARTSRQGQTGWLFAIAALAVMACAIALAK